MLERFKLNVSHKTTCFNRGSFASLFSIILASYNINDNYFIVLNNLQDLSQGGWIYECNQPSKDINGQ